MAYSLYDAIVPSYLQILRGATRWLDKAGDYASANGIAEADMMDARLAADMLPFNRQVRGFAMHAQGGIQGAFDGQFSPDPAPAPTSFAGLKDRLAEAVAAVEAVDPTEFETLVGRPMLFVLGETRLPFLADQFLLSFSQPNFYFHASMAYAILRNKGVNLGKRDYLAGLRIAAG